VKAEEIPPVPQQSDDVVVREILPPDTGLAFGAMQALRPNLPNREAFIRQVDEVQRNEGYRLVCAFEQGSQDAKAVAGFRTGHGLAWGHYLYVDDLSTLPGSRRRGYARMLLDWVAAEGRRLGCNELHLDSGVGAERTDAHRLYLRSGLNIVAHHFARPISDE
jgi:GNAT superfamily N-acetyltransferase